MNPVRKVGTGVFETKPLRSPAAAVKLKAAWKNGMRPQTDPRLPEGV
jgi:hypothetical protein